MAQSSHNGLKTITDVPAQALMFDPNDHANGVSIVTPMYNEDGGAVGHVQDIVSAFETADLGPFEIIVIDDGSTDGTCETLKRAREQGLVFRLLRHQKNAGQSRAIRTGVIAARYPVIAMIDGDGQNDPADLPRLVKSLRSHLHDDPTHSPVSITAPITAMIAGERQKRQDSGAKKVASRIANAVRQKLLDDGAADSGCGLKVFYKDAFLRLPYFDHIHRYLPFLMKREGYRVVFEPVAHRPRLHGASKYTNFGRLAVAFRDLAGVLWLKSRARSPERIKEE